jgi:Flp pilus assembly protein TadG
MVEFAIASTVLFPCMMGAFMYGHTFYTYNLLESSVANGARYGAFRTYRSDTAADIEKGKVAIRNMTVYGTPSPGDQAVPLVKNLALANVEVNYIVNAKQIPLSVTVSVKNFAVKSVFNDFQLKDKPRVTLPYLGRYAPNESEF